mgnify:FL=1
MHVLPVLQLKLEEFYTLHNYQEITKEELWEYCVKYKFENKDIEKQPIHRIVKVIFNVSVLEIKDFKQVLDDCSQSYQGNLTKEEISFLLGSSGPVWGLVAKRNNLFIR